MGDADALKAARAAVAALRPLRDQMRTDRGHHLEPEEVLADEVDRLEAERGRLRAVIDVLRSTAEAVVADENPDDDDAYAEGNLSAWTFVLRQLSQLDVSREATDGA